MKPLWKRLILTIIGMVVASLLVGLLWRATFDARIPSYLSGLVGGFAALALWEFLRPKE
jgi:uncharacterized membrane protein YeaQ/YmgE (transglycosylase-associated protein family)